MRRIEFRAWDGIEMSYSNTEYFDDMVGFRFKHFNVDGLENPILMQFTGLLDCEGNKIFEGDIVKDYMGRLKIVEYFEDGFWLNASLNGAEWNLRKIHKNCEIIGNIYKNPELLEKIYEGKILPNSKEAQAIKKRVLKKIF